MVITRKLKLYPPNKTKLKEIVRVTKEYKKCVNFWIDKIRHINNTGIYNLHCKYYYEARSKHNILAITVQLAMFKAIRIARNARKKTKLVPYMEADSLAVPRTLVEGNNLGLMMGKGRTWIPFKSQRIPKGKIKESVLKQVSGEWYCFLSLDIGEPKKHLYKRVLGVDLGLAKIATVSTSKGKHTTFFRGDRLRYIKSYYYNKRKELQDKLKQGNVYKVLKRISKRERNWTTTENHRISREIVNQAKRLRMGIAVENLRGITERLNFNKKTRRMIKGWSFRQLSNFISYKADLEGLPYVTVDPRETSKRCPKCLTVSRSNRKSQSRFKCMKCKYESNADRIGAMNIALKGTELLVYPIAYGQQTNAHNVRSAYKISLLPNQ